MKHTVPLTILVLLSFLLFPGCGGKHWDTLIKPTDAAIDEALSYDPVTSDLQLVKPHQFATVNMPESVRPCCAVGNAQRVQVAGLQVPFFRYANTVGSDELGAHAYEAGVLSYQRKEPRGKRAAEGNGQIYTLQGGFIDIAHVRDTADNAIALFQRIYPRLGEAQSISLPDEIGPRELRIASFDTAGLTAQQQLEISAHLAARQAYYMAEAHELAQWHGYRSWKPWSEEVSAYSFEDLYSNMLGAKIAYGLLVNNLATTKEQYNQHMTWWLRATVEQLGAVSREQTDLLWDAVDGHWWDSREPLPNKFMLLKRHYRMGDSQEPYLLPRAMAEEHSRWDELEELYSNGASEPLNLGLPRYVHGQDLEQLADQWLWVDRKFRHTFSHIPEKVWGDGFTQASFGRIAEENRKIDQLQLQEHQEK